MARYQTPFEIHVHGDVLLRAGVTVDELWEALKPMWQYGGATNVMDGRVSSYEEEPGLVLDQSSNKLQLCWTVAGDEDFRQVMEDTCMGLNDLAERGAAIEVSFYDTEFDDEDRSGEDGAAESRDDFLMCFVGPTPAAIMQVQRDMLVQDVVHIMERHFDAAELGPVVQAIDGLFDDRLNDLVSSMQLGKPPRGPGGNSGPGGPNRGPGGRKPRHLH
ncbi:MAG: hypothetical protein NWS83_07690 [Burkholderiaceae bacterium]|jgi:hypothetical protein|nr:hypothetical protein [Burkholderiaceae bacterium]